MLLASNKPTIVRQAVATAGPEEEKIKKFATAIVEFSKVRKRLKSRELYQRKGHAQMVCHSLFDHSKCSVYFGRCALICSFCCCYSASHKESSEKSSGRDWA